MAARGFSFLCCFDIAQIRSRPADENPTNAADGTPAIRTAQCSILLTLVYLQVSFSACRFVRILTRFNNNWFTHSASPIQSEMDFYVPIIGKTHVKTGAGNFPQSTILDLPVIMLAGSQHYIGLRGQSSLHGAASDISIGVIQSSGRHCPYLWFSNGLPAVAQTRCVAICEGHCCVHAFGIGCIH